MLRGRFLRIWLDALSDCPPDRLSAQLARAKMIRPAPQWLCAVPVLPYLPPMPVKSDPATWTDARHRRGLAGEMVAKRYLETVGYRTLAHRFRVGRLEIDLIVRKGPVVAFVEVKTRRNAVFGSPLEAVTWAKQRDIALVAQCWMDRHGGPTDEFRFDVVGVTLTASGRASVQHVEDAFRPGWR